MSRQHSEKLHPPVGDKKPRRAEPTSNFVSFHPTEAEKRVIKETDLSASQALDILETEVRRGLSLNITRTKSNDAYCLTVKPFDYVYGESQCLAAFHGDMTRLLQLTVYLLTVKYPEWPEKPAVPGQLHFDW